MLRSGLLAFALLLVFPAAARAQFYDLDGTYRCVTAPDAACAERFGGPTAPSAPVAKESAAPNPAPSFDNAIARVRQRAATTDDMRVIEAHAADKDPRALEVLAWCRLNGIGMPADPLAAYWLYRDAAGLGVANARKNQVAIFESRLTSEQRQQVLLKENER